MLSQLLNPLRRVFGLPMILLFVHATFMLWVSFIWYQAAEKYGTADGVEQANFGHCLVHFVDFPMYKLCEYGIHTAFKSQSPALGSILSWILDVGDDGFRNLEIRLYLPLLLLLGSIQWVLVGYGVRWIKKFMYARLGKRTG
jgi:hypothetical protein